MENINGIKEAVFDAFEIDSTLLPATAQGDELFKQFRSLLIRRVEELAEKDMEKLLWILYRVDVSEKKLYEVMAQTTPENFSSALADLIIERQIQKAESRKKYGGTGSDWSFDV